jgi:catechol 2,3-dioxygenase-like lactoylglutathione lyase family enzyme
MPRVVHFEIYADDPEAVCPFYEDVFGWQIKKWNGPQEYWLVTTGGEGEPGINGGMMPSAWPEPRNDKHDRRSITRSSHQKDRATGWNDLCAQNGDSRCRLVGLRTGSHRKCVWGAGTRYQRKIIAPG